MVEKNQTETDEQKAAAEAKAAEEKATAEKAATEQEAAATKLGTDFDKKADEGEGHSAYTETPEEKEAKEKADAKAKADADEKASKEDPGKGVDESLLERAEKAGMSREKAGEFSGKEDLERTVELLEESQSEARSEKAKTPEELETEKKAKEDAEAKVKDDEAPYDCKLDPAEYDEGFIKTVNDLGTMFKKRIVALEAGQTNHAKAFDSDRVTKHTDWLDSRFGRLSDDDLKKIYGEGDFDDLEENSEQFKARAALDTEIAKIAAGLRKAKKSVPSRNKLFDMAIEALHKGKKTKVDAKTVAKLKARAAEALGAGSSRVSAETAEAQASQLQKDFDEKIDE